MPDRAVGELERARALMGPRPDVITPHAYVLARAGRQLEARAMLDELRRISKPRDPAPIRIAFLHIGLGEIDRAFEWLDRAIEPGTGRWRCSISNPLSTRCGPISALQRWSSASGFRETRMFDDDRRFLTRECPGSNTWRGRTVEPSAAPRTIRTIDGVSGAFS